MIVTIHQPEFLPYAGFFSKLMHSDIMILLDDVFFNKNYFQNRNRIMINGEVSYVTVPVQKKRALIKDVQIIEPRRSLDKIIKTLTQHVLSASCRHSLHGLVDIFRLDIKLLCDLNCRLLFQLRKILGLGQPVLLASELGVPYTNKSQYLLDLVKRAGGSAYLSGAAGVTYLDASLFLRKRVKVMYHHYHCVEYTHDAPAFVPNLSIIDLLMNVSPENIKDVIYNGAQVVS